MKRHGIVLLSVAPTIFSAVSELFIMMRLDQPIYSYPTYFLHTLKEEIYLTERWHLNLLATANAQADRIKFPGAKLCFWMPKKTINHPPTDPSTRTHAVVLTLRREWLLKSHIVIAVGLLVQSDLLFLRQNVQEMALNYKNVCYTTTIYAWKDNNNHLLKTFVASKVYFP